MRQILNAAVILLVPAILFADVLLNVNFDNHSAGPYTKSMAAADFPGASWYNGMDEGWGEIVPGRYGGGNALRMKYPAGQFGPNNSAIQIKAVLSKAVDTAWVSYWVKFENGFDFVKGGKLPGLCGGECITGGNDANGYNGWSARVMWRREGGAVQYMYYVTNEGYGEDLLFDKSPPKKRFIPGQWHRVNTQIIMNTPGTANGVIRTWFDGELSMERKDILIRHTDTLKIDLFYISTFFGGSDATWAPNKDMYITYDDFLVVSRRVSSPYPQTLYELSVVSGKTPFSVTADLSASLGNDLSWNVDFAGYTSSAAEPASLMAATADINIPGVYSISANVWSGNKESTSSAQRKIFALGEYDMPCDSAWQAAVLRDSIRAGDTLGIYLTIIDTMARIMMGPTITDDPRGEFSFFGALRYDNGTFSALNGNGVYLDNAGKYGAGTYKIDFICNFTANPMTYSVSIYDEHGANLATWNDLNYRGYAKAIGSYGTWASRDQTAVAHMKPWNYGTSARLPIVRPVNKKLPSVKVRKNGLILSASGTSTPTQIEIFNAKGVLIKRASVNGKTDLFVPLRSKGLYLYMIKNSGDVVRGVAIVRH